MVLLLNLNRAKLLIKWCVCLCVWVCVCVYIYIYEASTKRYEDQRAKAIKMLGKIKSRFEGDDYVYKSFLDILKMHKNEGKSISEVYQEVVALFQGHEDLLEELNHYLLDTPFTASAIDEFAQNSMLHDMSSAKPTRERTMDSRGEFEWTMDDRAKRRKSLALADVESSKKEN